MQKLRFLISYILEKWIDLLSIVVYNPAIFTATLCSNNLRHLNIYPEVRICSLGKEPPNRLKNTLSNMPTVKGFQPANANSPDWFALVYPNYLRQRKRPGSYQSCIEISRRWCSCSTLCHCKVNTAECFTELCASTCSTPKWHLDGPELSTQKIRCSCKATQD